MGSGGHENTPGCSLIPVEEQMKATQLFTFATAALLGASLALAPIVSAAEGAATEAATGSTKQVAMTHRHRGAAHHRKHHAKRHHTHRRHRQTAKQ